MLKANFLPFRRTDSYWYYSQQVWKTRKGLLHKHPQKLKVEKKTLDWATIAVEVSSVVFAVLLALFLNEWRQGIRNEASLEQARLMLREEMKRNHDELDSVIVKQTVRIEKYGALVEEAEKNNTSVTVLSAITSSGGLSFPLLEQTTWETIKLNRTIEFFTMEELKMVSYLYSFQLHINEHNKKLQDAIFSSSSFSSSPEEQKQHFSLFLAMLQQSVEWETELVKEYEKTLKTF